MSKGENKIVQILKANKISFKREVTFPYLNGKKKAPLRFDFAIYRNGQLVGLLEYDGEPHFLYSSYFNKNFSSFMYRKECDRKKNAYALTHHIPLYRIPFWDYDKLTDLKSLFLPEYLVKSIYHNDQLTREKFGGDK